MRPLIFVHPDSVKATRRCFPYADVRGDPDLAANGSYDTSGLEEIFYEDISETSAMVIWPYGEESMRWPVMLSREVLDNGD